MNLKLSGGSKLVFIVTTVIRRKRLARKGVVVLREVKGDIFDCNVANGICTRDTF